MKTDTRIQLAAGAVLALALASAMILTPSIAAEAGRAQLVYTDRAEEGDPPEVAVGIALGAFRGLFVNILWFRAEKLKQEGKFHEAVQLSRTITRLQPRFPRVWAFLAWNMAYNISVATHTARERWQWVNEGIRLLRDEAIPRNPNDALLHKELAWLFFHKIQGFADDANQYYKRELAREWTFVLGPPAPDAPTREERVQQRIDMIQSFADAPDTLEALYAQADAMDDPPPVRELVRRLREEARLDLDEELLRLFTLRVMFDFSGMREFAGAELTDANRNLALESIMNEPGMDAAWQLLIPYVRKRVVVDRYHMEPDRMIRYTRIFGPLDWRHPCAHAIYWLQRGLEEAMRRRNKLDFDLTNTDRTLMGAIQDMFRWGTINYDLISDSYVQMFNFDYVEVYGRVFEEIVVPRANRRGPIDSAQGVEREDRPFRVMAMGYVNFLRDVTRIYYRMGEREKAAETFERLRTWQGINYNESEWELGLSLDEFIRLDFEERIDSPMFAATEFAAALRDGFLRGLLRGNRELFTNQRAYAYEVHQHYQKRQNRLTIADPNANRMNFLPPIYIDGEKNVLLSVLMELTAGSNAALPIEASLLYRRLPLRTAQAAYDDIVNLFGARVRDFDRWFPEPPGMEEYRTLRAELDAGSDAARKALNEIEIK
ncbi:MAG: hypothetical protein D6693_01140 [Planctomycetota bacterium]|nr:MAG: hypothetical protein D6693_01140 [Planctomycetota bacterium]